MARRFPPVTLVACPAQPVPTLLRHSLVLPFPQANRIRCWVMCSLMPAGGSSGSQCSYGEGTSTDPALIYTEAMAAEDDELLEGVVVDDDELGPAPLNASNVIPSAATGLA